MISTSWFLARRSNKIRIERLGETRIRNGRGQPVRRQRLGRLHAFREPRTVGQQRNRAAFAQNPALADFKRNADLRQIDADTIAARIAQRRGRVVERRLRRHHVNQFGLIRRRHQDEMRQAAEIGDVERAGMGGAVGADQAGAIQDEPDRQFLDRNIVHHLIVGALQEGRVDRDERLQPFGREPCSECYAVLFGNADIESPLRKRAFRKYRCRCPDGIAAVMATMRSSFSASLTRLSPKTLV